MSYAVNDRLKLYLQRKVPGRLPPPPAPDTIIEVQVTEVAGEAYAVTQRSRTARLAGGLLTYYCIPPEQWYVLGIDKV